MCVPLTTATSTPCAQSVSITERTALASAVRSATAVPSQSNITASNRCAIVGGSSSTFLTTDLPGRERV
jgi:hypothetical protein